MPADLIWMLAKCNFFTPFRHANRCAPDAAINVSTEQRMKSQDGIQDSHGDLRHWWLGTFFLAATIRLINIMSGIFHVQLGLECMNQLKVRSK